MAIYKGAEGFPDKSSQAYDKRVIAVTNDPQTIILSLPAGVYGISCYHDENGSGELEKNMFGYPKEGFGFSNNPSLGISAPDFDECQFNVDGKAGQTVDIEMKH